LEAATPTLREPLFVVPAQFNPELVPNAFTTLEKVQDWPAMLIAKLAVPAADGVPVMVKTKLPCPGEKLPWTKVAVNPVTPVEVTDCPT
jgi:hypothetical protein